MWIGQQTAAVFLPGEQVGKEFDRLAVGDLGRRLRRREHLDLRRTRSSCLADGPLTEPAELVGMEDLREFVLVFQQPHLHELRVGRDEPSCCMRAEQAGHPAEAIRDSHRAGGGERGHGRDLARENRKRVEHDPEAPIAVAHDRIGVPEALGDRPLVAHHDQRPLAVAADDEPCGPAVITPVAAEVVDVVSAEGGNAVDILCRHPASQAFEAAGRSLDRDPLVKRGVVRPCSHGPPSFLDLSGRQRFDRQPAATMARVRRCGQVLSLPSSCVRD